MYVFVKGRALIHSGKWEGHDFFRKKFLKYPDPPLSIKNVPSLTKSCYCSLLCDAALEVP